MQGAKEVNAFDNIFPNADKISIDSKSGEPHSTDFDVFKNIGRYKYTFRNTCDEIPGLALGDGATKIFLNTKGTVRDKESDLLINFLHYVNESTMEKALVDRKLIELHEILESVKGDSKSMGDYVNTEWARIEGEERS